MLETFRALEDRDLERRSSLYHSGVELVWPESLPHGGTFRGLESPPPGRTRDGYHQRGVNQAGQRLDQEVLGWYTVDGGKFARAQMFYFDTATLAAFLADA